MHQLELKCFARAHSQHTDLSICLEFRNKLCFLHFAMICFWNAVSSTAATVCYVRGHLSICLEFRDKLCFFPLALICFWNAVSSTAATVCYVCMCDSESQVVNIRRTLRFHLAATVCYSASSSCNSMLCMHV